MTIHATHPAIIKRLKRVEGHVKSIVSMLEQGRDCLDIAQQLQAVENAIINAKKAMVHDHIDHCLEHVVHKDSRNAGGMIREFKEITKFL